MGKNKDLTVGNPDTVLRNFCLPLFGSILFQQLYNLADSFVAGRVLGEEALAAVGNSYEITLIYLAVAFGCNIGCSVVVSRLFGAKQYREMKSAVYTTLIAVAVLCGTLMALGLGFSNDLMHLIHTPENIYQDSLQYLTIYTWSLPFVFFYNISTGIFSAMGDSKTPFLFLACSSVANIIGDYWFVTAFHTGVEGVAWATLICQGISCILSVIVMLRRFTTIETGQPPQIFSWRLLGRVAQVAVPSILQQSFVSVGNIIIQRIINDFGSGVIAGYTSAIKLNNLVVTSLSTIGNGVSNFTSQNIGAAKMERVRSGYRAGLRFVAMICLPLSVLYFTAGKYLVYFFLPKPTESALATGVLFLRIVSPFYMIIAGKLLADGVLRGAGKMNQFMVATFTDLLLRVVLAKVLSVPLESTGIWIAWPIGWTIATLISVAYYRKGEWCHLSETEQKTS
ncbi:MAG: MATE family efflux transporter [Oscillospiraceae bacterium]|nr:MATE family efflux transporter [Oscillospiraceae bacterium]